MKQYKNLSDNYAGANLVSIPCSLSRDEETYSDRLVSRELGAKYPDEYRSVLLMVPEGIDYTPDYQHISIDYTDIGQPGKVRVPVPGGFCWCRVLWEA